MDLPGGGGPISLVLFEKWGYSPPGFTIFVWSVLEPQLRTKGNSQVVVSAAMEIDIVANLSAKANRSSKGFNTAARIDREVGCTVG